MSSINLVKSGINPTLNFKRYLIQSVRTFCSKKEEIIEKLADLENKLQKAVEKKALECLETPCSHKDTSLPDCKPSKAKAAEGRNVPVKPLPTVCPGSVDEQDHCIRPYVNPCQPYPVKPCSPFHWELDPCRSPCVRPKRPPEQKLTKLSLNTLRILFALSTMIGMAIVYYVLSTKPEPPSGIKRVARKKPPSKVPLLSSDIPDMVPYVVVGGGPAAYSAIKTIMENDSEAKILVLNKEPYFLYNRTPLNNEMIVGDVHLRSKLMYIPHAEKRRKSIFFEHDNFYSPVGMLYNLSSPGAVVGVARGWSVSKVNPATKTVTLEDGKRIKYEKCILATGASPKNISVFEENNPDVLKRVQTYSTVEDYKHLDVILKTYGTDLSIAIVGGGLNGSELACALKKKGVNVHQIYKEEGNMQRILPNYLSNWLTARISSMGVKVLTNTEVTDAVIYEGCGNNHGKLAIHVYNKKYDQNSVVYVDRVVVFGGQKPNTELAAASAIEVDEERGGFLVNREMQICTDLFAVGDCISFYDTKYGRRHIERYEHAVESGKVGAENLFGKGKSFNFQAMLWSDLMPTLGCEAVGIVDSSLPTVGVYVKDQGKVEKINQPQVSNDSPNVKKILDFNKGIIFYLKNDLVVGVLTWNVFNRANMIRNILNTDSSYSDIDSLTKSLQIHYG